MSDASKQLNFSKPTYYSSKCGHAHAPSYPGAEYARKCDLNKNLCSCDLYNLEEFIPFCDQIRNYGKSEDQEIIERKEEQNKV